MPAQPHGKSHVGEMRFYRTAVIVRRWTLTERKARWLVRSIPERERQAVYYERRGIGWRVTVEDRFEEPNANL